MPVITSLVQVATAPAVVEVGAKSTATPWQIAGATIVALDSTGVGFTHTITDCTLTQFPAVFKV